MNKKILDDIATELRIGAFEILNTSKNGHLGATSSSVELFTSLYFNDILNYDFRNPRHPDRDRVLVRGHLGPLRYKLFSIIGWINENELKKYRQYGSRLKGHEDMNEVPGVDITPSGSLGMLLSYGVGCCIAAKKLNKSFKTFVFLGDGEEQEGNVSEAARSASALNLDNIICIIDSNGKQLSRPTKELDPKSNIRKIWEGYGWGVISIKNGHDVHEISNKINKIKKFQKKPILVIAHTIKGKDVPGCKSCPNGYHTLSSCKGDVLNQAIETLTKKINRTDTIKIAKSIISKKKIDINTSIEKNYRITYSVKVSENNNNSMDFALGHYFKSIDNEIIKKKNNVYFLIADWIRKEFIENSKIIKYIDVGIREQHLIATAHGISVTDRNARVIVNIGDFLSYRCADQINACAQGQSSIMIIADSSGLTHAQNGKTHQSAGQPGMIFSMPGVNFFEPADVQDLYDVLNQTLTINKGINYVRVHRKNVDPLPRVYRGFRKNKYYICVDDKKPNLILVGSGLTTGELYETSKILKKNSSYRIRLINIINHKSLGKIFSRYFNHDTPVFIAYNGSPDFLAGHIALTLVQNKIRIPDIQSHGFYFGDTGTMPQLLDAYMLSGSKLASLIKKKNYRSI